MRATRKAWQMTRGEWLAAGRPDHGVARRRPSFGADPEAEREAIGDFFSLFDDPCALIQDSYIGVPEEDIDKGNRDESVLLGAHVTLPWRRRIVEDEPVPRSWIMRRNLSALEDVREAIICGRMLGYPDRHVLGYVFRNYVLLDVFMGSRWPGDPTYFMSSGCWNRLDDLYERFKYRRMSARKLRKVIKAYPSLAGAPR